MNKEQEKIERRRDYMKNWRHKNAEKIKEYSKEYNKEYRRMNLEKIKEYKKEYQLLNLEKIKEYRKEYRRENKQIIKKKKRAEYLKNYEKNKNYRKKYFSENSIKLLSYQKDKRNEFPERYKARYLINNAVARGDINPQPCIVCGKENAHGHHTDYSKPFQVEWLCPYHHTQAHARR